MAIKVSVNSISKTKISVNQQQRRTIRTVGLGIQNPSIIKLGDVDILRVKVIQTPPIQVNL